MPRKPTLLELLSNIPLFGEMDSNQLHKLVHATHRHSLKRGETLFQKGDPSDGFYFVVEGQIKLALVSPEGGEKVVEIISPGMSFGEAVMFIDKPYPAFAEALCKSEVLHIRRDVVMERIERDNDFACRMLAGLSRKLHGLVSDMEDLTLHSAAQRIIGYLLREQGDEGHVVHLKASKSLIASRLNLTPETFSRVLHQLQRDGLITIDGRTITIPDIEALSSYGATGK